MRYLSSFKAAWRPALHRLIVPGALLLLLAAAVPHALSAQGGGNDQGNATAQRNPDSAAAQHEDEEAVYKKSASVRAIGHALHLSPEHSAVLFEDLNFLILFGIIGFYAAKLLPRMFRERQGKLDKQLLIARMATEEANERLIEVEERLRRLDDEIKELRTRSELEGSADEERVKAAIEEERRKIVASTEQEIAALSANAERNLRRFATELAVDRAASRLKLTEADDRQLVSSFHPVPEASLQERRN